MKDRPKRSEIQHSIEVVRRWNAMAKSRMKNPAIVETQRILDILEYYEQHG